MRGHQLLSADVDIKELAVETKNFSGAELEGLVRAAQSTAMNRHIKVRKLSERAEPTACKCLPPFFLSLPHRPRRVMPTFGVKKGGTRVSCPLKDKWQCLPSGDQWW